MVLNGLVDSFLPQSEKVKQTVLLLAEMDSQLGQKVTSQQVSPSLSN